MDETAQKEVENKKKTRIMLRDGIRTQMENRELCGS